MTNTIPQGSNGAPSSTHSTIPSASMPPRRSSYASVAAGTATTTPQGMPQVSESDQRTQSNQRTSENTNQTQERSNIPSSWGRGGTMSNITQYSFGGTYAVQSNLGSSSGGFFVPSYLRESRYMEQLEAAHKANAAAYKEAASTTNTLSNNSSTVSLHKITPSHRGMTYDVVENHPVADEGDLAPLPSKWAEVDKYGGLEIVADGLDVRYTGPLRSHEHEAPAARADHPMPPQCGIFYYEVTIIHKGKEGIIGIGFSGKRASLEKLPGWEPESWAYHGDDGMTFQCQGTGKKYGPTFTTNDVVGCGVNFMTNSAFFTKNGVFQGIAFRDLKEKGRLYPSVGAKKPGAHLRANFGQTKFMFDIDGMMAQEKSKIMAEINLTSIAKLQPPLSEDALIKQLVSQFLRHDGYVDTAKAYAKEMAAESKALMKESDGLPDFSGQDDTDAINRQQIRAAILDGDIDKALNLTNIHYPSVLSANPRINFRLRCRKFVEMMWQSTEYLDPPRSKPSNGHLPSNNETYDQAMDLDDPISTNGEEENEWDNMETEDAGSNSIRYQEKMSEALTYASQLKFEYKGDESKEVKETLASIFAMFAYVDPRQSPIASTLDPGGRVAVAEELNSAILVSLGKSSAAALERLCQQTEVLLGEISEHGGPGAFINMDHDFLR